MSLLGLGAYAERRLVWETGHAMLGRDPEIWRRDDFGNVIKFGDYGDRSSAYGWEIDHVVPSALGGLDIVANKRPLHCSANASLGGLLSAALKR